MKQIRQTARQNMAHGLNSCQTGWKLYTFKLKADKFLKKPKQRFFSANTTKKESKYANAKLSSTCQTALYHARPL